MCVVSCVSNAKKWRDDAQVIASVIQSQLSVSVCHVDFENIGGMDSHGKTKERKIMAAEGLGQTYLRK